MSYYALEPFGEDRADRRAAIVAMVTANVNRSSKTKAYSLDDFMVKYDALPPEKKPKTKQSAEDIKKVLLSMARPKARKGK